MKALAVILLLSLEFAAGASYFSPPAANQPGNFFSDSLRAVNVKILPGSSLIIQGATNINKFRCVYQDVIMQYSRAIQLEKQGDVYYFNQANLQLNTASFDCGIPQMNTDFQELLQAETYPYLQLELAKVSCSEQQEELLISCWLSLSGTRRLVEFPLSCIKAGDDELICEGKLALALPRFHIDPPSKMMGLIQVKDEITVEFKLRLSLQ